MPIKETFGNILHARYNHRQALADAREGHKVIVQAESGTEQRIFNIGDDVTWAVESHAYVGMVQAVNFLNGFYWYDVAFKKKRKTFTHSCRQIDLKKG